MKKSRAKEKHMSVLRTDFTTAPAASVVAVHPRAAAVVVAASLTSFVWIVLFSLAPSFVRVVFPGDIFPSPDSAPDPVKCLFYAIVAAIAVAVVLWCAWRRKQSWR